MRLRLVPLLVLSVGLLACAGRTSHDRGGSALVAAPIAGQPVTVTLESPGVGGLPAALFGGALYYAGQDGQQYAIRIANNTAERVEVVVTVDGRDVVSGALGDYRKQRGYIVEPFGQVVVDGFRQSLDQVAAFRFSGLADGYSTLQGTPQHSGVIGIAVFEERARREKKTGPLAVGPAAEQAPFPGGGGHAEKNRRAQAPRTSGPEPFAGADHEARSDSQPSMAEDAGSAAPAASKSAPGSSFAPPPVPTNELATQYGESQSSSVHEVEFKRRHKRRPDVVLAIYYDSARGLAARGIPLGGATPAFVDPQPFPQRFPQR